MDEMPELNPTLKAMNNFHLHFHWDDSELDRNRRRVANQRATRRIMMDRMRRKRRESLYSNRSSLWQKE